jgi:hypothetical protein
MEVPGWHRGDLAFSFRTSSEKAILLYQPLLHPKHPYFRVLLVDGTTSLFIYFLLFQLYVEIYFKYTFKYLHAHRL